jgi:hypothetical protein
MEITNERYDELMQEYWSLHIQHKFDWYLDHEGEKNSITLPIKENNILSFKFVDMSDNNLEILLSSKLIELKDLFK